MKIQSTPGIIVAPDVNRSVLPGDFNIRVGPHVTTIRRNYAPIAGRKMRLLGYYMSVVIESDTTGFGENFVILEVFIVGGAKRVIQKVGLTAIPLVKSAHNNMPLDIVLNFGDSVTLSSGSTNNDGLTTYSGSIIVIESDA